MRFILAALIILIPPVFAADLPAIKATPMPDGSVVMVLPAEVVKDCNAHGGCAILNVDEMAEIIMHLKPKLCNQKEI